MPSSSASAIYSHPFEKNKPSWTSHSTMAYLFLYFFFHKKLFIIIMPLTPVYIYTPAICRIYQTICSVNSPAPFSPISGSGFPIPSKGIFLCLTTVPFPSPPSEYILIVFSRKNAIIISRYQFFARASGQTAGCCSCPVPINMNAL